jgi:hypothetical protein
MNAKRLAFVVILSILVLSACAPAMATQAPSANAYGGKVSSTQAPAATPAPASSSQGPVTGSDGGAPRLVIMNASLEIVVESPAAAAQTLSEMAQQMGGFVVTSNSYQLAARSGQTISQAKVTLRVPAERLGQALDRIRALVQDPEKDIHNETMSGQDVTEQYTDLNSQLVNLQAAEKQLQAILERATKTEDVLSVFHELTNTRQQIEVIQGKMKYYLQSAALSSIDVNILATASIAPIEIAGWQPLGIARDAVQTLINVGQALVTALIWIIIVFGPLGVVVYACLRLVRRFVKPGKRPMPPAPAA